MSKEERLRLAVNLEGEMVRRFLEVQKKLGIKSYTDVVRYLVKWYYDMLIVKKTLEE